MLNSLNHLTLAVSDLARSVDFYHQLLGLKLHARWDNGAYLTCGELWLAYLSTRSVSMYRQHKVTTPIMRSALMSAISPALSPALSRLAW